VTRSGTRVVLGRPAYRIDWRVTTTTDGSPPAPPPATPSATRRRRRLGASLGLVGALAAGGALLTLSPDDHQPVAPPGRITPASAWPTAQQAELPGYLPDGPTFNPVFLLDARTAVGTAADPGGKNQRLVLRAADGTVRELRRQPIDTNPQFTGFTADGDQLAWAETAEGGRTRMWAADLRTDAPARELTADTGNILFFDSQYDMVIAEGRLHWTAAAAAAADQKEPMTEVRSVALSGGAVDVHTEPGTWALSAWPWLVDGFAEQSGTTLLRNMVTLRDTRVGSAGTELVTCSPVWCRVMVMAGDGLARIDVMHPDGTARERIAGGAAAAAVTDVAVLDRFEVLSEAGPDTDLTGAEHLLVYDLATRRTVDVADRATAAVCRGGVLWWSTGDQDTTVWHTIDLRTV
jgi:hypothetical protein